VTAPTRKTARQIAKLALKARLAACASLVPGLESHYWWRGRLESGAEVLILLKTRARNLPRLERLILNSHPYDTPEIVALRPHRGTARYLKWLEAAC
jgi:periplasmic divalent cation tolerance protein